MTKRRARTGLTTISTWSEGQAPNRPQFLSVATRGSPVCVRPDLEPPSGHLTTPDPTSAVRRQMDG
jgi:hypothetical protein